MSEKRRQQKLAKRKAKSKQKQKLNRQSKSIGSEAGYIREGLKNPVFECLVDYSNKGQGMVHIMLSRMAGLNIVLLGSFLIDTFCLGVKDCFLKPGTTEQYESNNAKRPFQAIAPEDAKKILIDAVEWSRSIGFEPHKDFKKSFRIFDDVDEAQSSVDYEFGKDGKPLYVAGPFDSPEKIQMIKEKLGEHCGRSGDDFNLIIPGEGMDFDYDEGRWDGADKL